MSFSETNDEERSKFTNRVLRSSIDLRSSVDLTPRKLSALSVVQEDNVSKVEELKPYEELIFNRKKLYKNYADFYSKTKRSGSLAVPFTEYVDKQREELHEVFDFLDLDQDYHLNKNDISTVLDSIDPNLNNPDRIDRLIKDVTSENNDKINFKEFGDYFGGTYFGRYTTMELSYVFNLFDKDNDYYIGYTDLKKLFDPIDKNININKILVEMDKNRDGRVCFDDFKEVMNNYK